MRSAACWLVTMAVMALGIQSLSAEEKKAAAAKPASEFMNLPSLPACAKVSVKSGDPSKGGAVILAKAATGCTVPWHWHSTSEQLMVVSGSGKVEMKDGSPMMAHSGSYLNLPGHGVHQFTCTMACTFFIVTEAAFDIHYVDAAGKEISTEEALKSKAKAMKHEMKNDMKDMKNMKDMK